VIVAALVPSNSADLVYRVAWIKRRGNVYVTGDDPEGANDGLARRTVPRIGTYAMRLGRLGMFCGNPASNGHEQCELGMQVDTEMSDWTTPKFAHQWMFGGKALSQHSQLGLSSSIQLSVLSHNAQI